MVYIELNLRGEKKTKVSKPHQTQVSRTITVRAFIAAARRLLSSGPSRSFINLGEPNSRRRTNVDPEIWVPHFVKGNFIIRSLAINFHGISSLFRREKFSREGIHTSPTHGKNHPLKKSSSTQKARFGLASFGAKLWAVPGVQYVLMKVTRLKNISQIGSFPQVGVKIINI